MAGRWGHRPYTGTDNRWLSRSAPEREFRKWWLGAGCVKGASPVLRGGGAQSWTGGGGNFGWGASLTNTPRARRRIPCRARQEQWIHPTTTYTREALPYSP